MKRNHTFIYRNGLTLALVLFFIASFAGQIVTGWKEYNNERKEYHQQTVGLGTYLYTGHFLQATFENWESEFLQMGFYVLLTISLRQKGSSESKKLDGKEEVDREPNPARKGAPWPVRRKGWVSKVYKNSLSIAFALLFIVSFILHAVGSFNKYNEEQRFQKKEAVAFNEFMSGSRFWFESFQNWQSEFVAVISIVVLSIFLRQKGSPESKPVDASFEDTGNG